MSWYEVGDITETDEDWEYYSQALVDGGCFVYYEYPIDAPDADEDFDLENASTKGPKVLTLEH